MDRTKLVEYLDRYLDVGSIEDSSQNGLQVEGPDDVEKVAFAVDACQTTFERAIEAGADLLIVHHGLFWGESLPLVGLHFERVKRLIEGRCGLYAVHLPLDVHPEVGNNAELARLLELEDAELFGDYKGLAIGFGGQISPSVPVKELADRLARVTGEPVLRVVSRGPARVNRVACVSGGASFLVDQIAQAGFDTFVTGEPSHSHFHETVEYKLNVIYGGHYATETLGVKALARHLEHEVGLKTVFLDVPTGM